METNFTQKNASEIFTVFSNENTSGVMGDQENLSHDKIDGNILETDFTHNTEPSKKSNMSKHYTCDFCQYSTKNLSDYNRHINSTKHKRNEHVFQSETCLTVQQYKCDGCQRPYIARSGLWKHKKKCSMESEDDMSMSKELISELIKNSAELRELLFEQQQMMKDITKQGQLVQASTINQNLIQSHSNNKSFNLNFYLNETCKNAMDIMEFVDSIELQLSDLELVGELGYADGISDILITRLIAIDSSLRPVHCSDSKREIIYIKNGNVWIKEADAKPLLIKAIKKLANENIKMISKWRAKYPDCTLASSKKNDAYLRIVSNSMCGIDEAETKRNIEKIVSNIAKKVVIDKRAR